MTITLVRHGQTEENFLRKVQGRSNSMMNDTGRRQCQMLKMKVANKHYDYCYMSPLISIVETAMILIGDRVETVPDKRLLARGMGELEGRAEEEYNLYKFWDYDLNRNDYGIETIQDVFERCKDFLDYITAKHTGCDIMVVTHGEVYRALRHLLLNHELKGNLLDGAVDNCSFEEFEI